MKALAILPAALALSACFGRDCPPQPIKTVIQKETVEVQVPCKVAIPKRPAPVVAHEGDDSRAVNLRQKSALDAWGGAGDSYANLAEAAIRACQKGGK